ncbi:D-alanyl-D-alanine carboxypeptidase [Tenacibaculum sp. MAR_2009_124]|uniref:serine hydrolase n=1 Tax=Tenacibaculum sp. MAR_2009_124 TaxID=1250059 RepID=UPI0008986189|nr:serine hydrolase [Tenacibaculum sp. MAR_2009_124]SEC17143.1 D-alanyl-D-alanine carboxypeptidase [Tenacibaculum sp. MAR_2009_124]
MKKTFIMIGIIVLILIILGGIGTSYFKPDKNIVLNFIKENPEKASIKLIRNDSLIVEKNPDKMMPLASTLKIIIAIEYAEQAAKGLIDPNEPIPLSELDNYYVPNTDGGAQQNWLIKVKDKIDAKKIALREIVKGMIAFSSNANTEWLCKKLGLQNINHQLASLEIQNHSEIYYIVSALFIGKEVFPQLKDEELEVALRNLTIAEYRKATLDIHDKLEQDSTYKKEIGERGLNLEKIWSDNLPSSTVKEYVEIMHKINSRTYFSKETHSYLDEVMEFPLDDPTNGQWFHHLGMKGGSTAFVLTKALYATDKEENTTELSYFINDLNFIENRRLQMSMNEFESGILTNEEFREQLKNELSLQR